MLMKHSLNLDPLIFQTKRIFKGKRPHNAAEAIALSLGCCKLTLEVLEGNTVAHAAYKACGFAGYELAPNIGKAMFWQKKLG